MEFFKPNSNVDFMGARKYTAMISVFLFIISITALGMYGLKMGLDFTGGTEMELHFQRPADLKIIRTKLNKAGFKDAVVIRYGKSTDVLVSIGVREGISQNQLVSKVTSVLPGSTKKRVDYVGPQVGQELFYKGGLAVLVSLFATMIYIGLRFEYRFAISAAVALVHDPILILGIFAFLQYDFDLKALAAVLAVIGYSLNDTIVVFDRVRENFKKMKDFSALQVMNLSINQTLSRTIMTSALTLIVVLVLFFDGGETIHGFSLALIIGIVVGTYSSIYIAGALAISLGLSRADLMVSKQNVLDTP